jgi:DNA replication protein DnaC
MLEPIKPEQLEKIIGTQGNSLPTQKPQNDITPKSNDENQPCRGCGKIIPAIKLITRWAADTCKSCEDAAEKKYQAEQKAMALERRRQFVARCRAQSGLTEKEFGKTFASFKANDDNAKARTFAIEGLTVGNLMLIGDSGVGKTHLALAMVNNWIENGRPARFYPIWRLLSDARGAFDRGVTEVEFVDEIKQHPLVIDDLGSYKISEWALGFFEMLIDEWGRDGRQGLVITTNLWPDVIASRISKRIGSRLNEICRMIELKGQDHRA